MYRKTLTFENYDGEEITKNLYFRLTQAEIVDMEFNDPNGSVISMLRKMSNEKDMRVIVPLVKKFMLMSYCERQEDGTLIKNEKIRDSFAASEEYSELFMELISDIDKLADFINAIVPKAAQKNLDTMKKYDMDKIQEFIKTGDYSAFEENPDLKVVKSDAVEDTHTEE